MLPYSAAFEERLLRPDSPIRPIVVAQVVDKNSDGTLRAAIRQRRDDWGLADGAAAGPPPTLANFDLLENGDVRLHDTVTTVITKAGPPNSYFTNLSRGFPVTAPLMLWNGADRSDLELKRVKIWLNPRVSGAQTRQVARWKLEAYALVRFSGGGSFPSTPSLWVMVKIADALPVDVTNDAEGLVTFDFSAGAIVHRPKPKLHGPFDGIDPTPRTLFHVVALDAFGNNAANVGLGYDSGVNSVPSAGNTLSTYQLTQNTPYTGITFTGIGVDGGAVAGCPIMTIESGTYDASRTISFTTNPLNLGGAPAGDVQLIGRAHVPNGCAVTYQVRNDADSAWITYTDGQFMIADLGLTPSLNNGIRKFQAILASDASLTATPTLTGLGMEALSEVIFLRQTKVTGGNWAIDPHTMKGEIPEVLISFLRDGDKDYSSAIEDLLANNHIGDIRLRLYWGDEGLARKDWLHDDDFLIDGSHPRGPEVPLKCLSVLCLLRDLVPRFKIGGNYAPASDVSVAGWTTDTGSAVNLFSRLNEATFDDTTYIKSSLTPVNEGVEFLLPTLTDPVGRRHLVDYRFRKDASSGEQIDLTVQLRQGVGTIIASQVHTNIDTDSALSATPFTFSLTDAQIALITNYADLRIRFVANKSSGAGARRAIVTWLNVRTGGKQDQVAYSGTLKSVYDGLFNSELGIDGRYRGYGVEDIQSQNQVAKTIFQASGATNKPLGKAELDAIAYIAGCGITSEQGKIVAPNMFNVEPVRFLWPSSEISLDEAGPGYEERMPQLFATWKWNASKGDFDRQEYVAHAGALLHLGKARLDPAQWFDVEMAKWLSSEGLDASGVSLAGRVGVRQVQAIGPGLMLWPVITNYRFPMARPGDVVALQTDKFVGRDPNVARAIRGAMWVTAVIQSRDASARRFMVWVRNYSDMVPTALTGDRNGLGPATPHIMSITPDVADSGITSAVLVCASAAAVRIAVSTSAEPSAATVRAAPLQALDGAAVLRTATLATLVPGQTLYIAALAYEKADGSAIESPLVAAQAAMRYLPTLSILHTGPVWKATRLFVAWSGNAGVGSVKVATSTSSYPAAGTGTSQDGAENLFDAGPFNYGDLVYITVTPYAGAGATGNQGPALQYRTRLAAFPRPDFNPHQMLPNAGYEDGAVFVGFATPGGGSGSVVTDSTKAHSGNKYLQLSSAAGQFADAFTADDAGALRFFEVQPGDVVQFGGYAYRESGTSDVYYVIQVLDKDFNVMTTASTPAQNTAAYLLVQAEYLVPAGIKYVALFREVNHSGTATVARFDDDVFRIAFSKSTVHNPQGSVLPVPFGAGLFTGSWGGLGPGQMFVAFSWASQTLLRPDGTSITLPAPPAALAAPTLTQQAGGVRGATTLFARIGLFKDGHLEALSAESSLAVLANNVLKIARPANPGGYDGWMPLVGNVTNAEYAQASGSPPNSGPLDFATDYVEPNAHFTNLDTQYAAAMLGALVYLDLAPSTTYYFYPFYDSALAFARFAPFGFAVGITAPSMANANQAWSDGRIALSGSGMTVVVGAGGGSGSPTTGGSRLT